MARIIQWATGVVGSLCLQEVIRRADHDLAGLLVYNADKNGRDAGEIAGMDPVGIVATTDKASIIATDADCVIYTPLAADMNELDEDIVALLSSGKNVITTAGYFAPETRGEEVLRRLEEACRKGNATLFGTGIEPGFMFDRVAPTLTGMCADVEYVRVREICNATLHPAVAQLKDAVGIGQLPEDFHAETPYGRYWTTFFSEMITAVARGWGLKLDRIDTAMDVAVTPVDIHVPSLGTVPAGRIQGSRHRLTGVVGAKDLIRAEICWFVGEKAADWPVPTDRYRWEIDIEGRPSMRTVLEPVPSLEHPDQTAPDPAYTGTMATIINAIPDVIAAPPGLMHAPIFAPWRPQP